MSDKVQVGFTKKEKAIWLAAFAAVLISGFAFTRPEPADAACVSAPTRDTECGSWNKIGETFVCRSWRHFN